MNLQTLPEMQKSAERVDSVGALLRGLIDYAGLFPPASLAMAPAVAHYDKYSRSDWNGILGRFVVPVARLGEFEQALAALPTSTSEANWRLSVLTGTDVVADLAGIREFNARTAVSGPLSRAVVDSVEMKVASPEEISRFSGIIPADLTTYFEVPQSSWAECIAAMAAFGRRAKIRTGGETAEKFPSPESVIEFIRLCAAANVPFKATAGLHHPLRSVHRFTYQPESASGIMHGFINLFLAAAFLRTGMEAALAVQLLEEQSPQAFLFERDEAGWRQYRLSRREIAAARQNFAISFGSCSFTEAIDDLHSLHLL